METSKHRYRIMVIDDNDSILNLMTSVLQDSYEVCGCSSGEEGLSRLPLFKPHLILLDIMMPGISGYETCQRIRDNKEFEGVKILFLSAKSDLQDRLKGYEVKGDDYLVKPFDNEELLAKVSVYFRLVKEEEKRKQAELELKAHEAHLERMVRERTEALMETNEDLKREIEEKRRAEQKLQKSEEKYRSVLENIEEGYYELDLEGRLTFFNDSLARIFSFSPEVMRGKSFRQLSSRIDVDKFKSTLDTVYKTGKPSPVMKWEIPTPKGTKKYWESSMSLITEGDEMHGYRGILRDVTDRYIEEKSLEGLFQHAVGTLARAAEVFDQDTGDHTVRIGNYSKLLSELVGMDSQYQKDIQISAQLHDVGKIHITSAMLNKNGRLSDEEFETIKNHTLYGSIIIGRNPDFKMANEIAMFHHEKWNGTGYPDGLRGRAIPLSARIVAIVDVFDALISKRAYKKAFSYDEAKNILSKGDYRLNPFDSFDPGLLEIFLDNYSSFVEIHQKSQQLEEIFEKQPLNVLVLEDDEVLRETVADHFKSTLDYINLVEFGKIADMKEYLRQNRSYLPHLCFIDVGLPDGSGHDAADYLNERFPDSHLICITDDEDINISKVYLYGHRVFRKNPEHSQKFFNNLIKTAEIIREHHLNPSRFI